MLGRGHLIGTSLSGAGVHGGRSDGSPHQLLAGPQRPMLFSPEDWVPA